MYMGESDSTASQPSKPVVIEILGRAGVEVKQKTDASGVPFKPASPKGLAGVSHSPPLWKNCERQPPKPPFSGVTVRKTEAYLPLKWSTIIASASSVFHPSLRASTRKAPKPIPAIRLIAIQIPASAKMLIRIDASLPGSRGG